MITNNSSNKSNKASQKNDQNLVMIVQKTSLCTVKMITKAL